MGGILLNWRISWRHKTSVMLVLLFTAAATALLLIYPRFIQDAEVQLAHAQNSAEVTGWVVNTAGYEEPEFLGSIMQAIVDTGYLGNYQTRAYLDVTLHEKDYLEALNGVVMGKVRRALEAASSEPLSEETVQAYFEKQLLEEAFRAYRPAIQGLCGLNIADAENGFARQSHLIQWAEGYSLDCLSGNDLICILPKESGYVPGEEIPVMVKPYGSENEDPSYTLYMTVAGIYPKQINELILAYCPIGTTERLCWEGGWPYYVSSLAFEVAENHDLPALKQALTGMGLDGSDTTLNIRVAIDDRVLQGTTAPIQSNLALLQGLQKLFFGAVAVVGFFLCFLLARGRRPEYAIMRLLGESTLLITGKALLEQAILCAAGILSGAMLLLIAGHGTPDLHICSIIWLCYTLGAAFAALFTVRINVMTILRDKG